MSGLCIIPKAMPMQWQLLGCRVQQQKQKTKKKHTPPSPPSISPLCSWLNALVHEPQAQGLAALSWAVSFVACGFVPQAQEMPTAWGVKTVSASFLHPSLSPIPMSHTHDSRTGQSNPQHPLKFSHFLAEKLEVRERTQPGSPKLMGQWQEPLLLFAGLWVPTEALT